MKEISENKISQKIEETNLKSTVDRD